MIGDGNPIPLGNIKRLLLSGSERLSRRGISLIELDCGGFRTPRSSSATR